MNEISGLIFNIQRYSLHDGSGIRTIVFFKSCPLACQWCSNPESKSCNIEMFYSKSSCIGCGQCMKACQNRALTEKGWDRNACLYCYKCSDSCPTGARQFAGKLMSVDDVVREATKDWAFYQTSGGGVTFSGGEPLLQSEFAAHLAKKLKDRYYNLAIETCGYAKWDFARKVLEQMDEILYDIKIMDSEKHKLYTGVPNALILENAQKCAKLNKNMVIRIPVIGGVNDDEENIKRTAEFTEKIGVKALHLLPYHRYGESKYEKLSWEYTFKGVTPSDERMELLKGIVNSYGIVAKIGG